MKRNSVSPCFQIARNISLGRSCGLLTCENNCHNVRIFSYPVLSKIPNCLWRFLSSWVRCLNNQTTRTSSPTSPSYFYLLVVRYIISSIFRFFFLQEQNRHSYFSNSARLRVSHSRESNLSPCLSDADLGEFTHSAPGSVGIYVL